MWHWGGLSAKTAQQCPRSLACQVEPHPHLVPPHCGPPFLPQRLLPGILDLLCLGALVMRHVRPQLSSSNQLCLPSGLGLHPICPTLPVFCPFLLFFFRCSLVGPMSFWLPFHCYHAVTVSLSPNHTFNPVPSASSDFISHPFGPYDHFSAIITYIQWPYLSRIHLRHVN